MAEKLAADILHDRADAWCEAVRPAELPPGVVQQALEAVPADQREIAKEEIAAAQRDACECAVPGPVHWVDPKLRRLRRYGPALQLVVRTLERQALRNDIAIRRLDAAKALQHVLRFPPPEPDRGDLRTKEGAKVFYEYQNRLARDPIARLRHNHLPRLRDRVVWTERAVVALEAGEDAAYLINRALACEVEIAHERNDALVYKHFDVTRQRLGQGQRRRHAVVKETIARRNEWLVEWARQVWCTRPKASVSRVAQILAAHRGFREQQERLELPPLSARRIRAVIAKAKPLATSPMGGQRAHVRCAGDERAPNGPATRRAPQPALPER